MPQKPLESADYTGQIGRHLTRVEDDTLCVKIIGHYSADEARQVMTIADAHYEQYGTSYLLSDMTEGSPPPLETRRLIASWPLRGRYGASGYGISRPIRVLMQLMVASRRLLGRQTVEVYIAESEADARRWIAEHRSTVQAERAKGR